MPVKSLLCLGAVALLSPFAEAQVNFQFDYSDPTAALWSPESRAALTVAANNMSAYLTGYNTTITFKITGSNANNGSLAGAGSRYIPQAASFANLGVIGDKIIPGGNNPVLSFDGTIDANFFHSWSYTDTVSSSQYDFVSVMMHEIAHAMGFASLLTESGDSAFGDREFTPFDSFLVNSAGQPLVYQGSFTTGPEWDAASTGGTGNGIFFNGPRAMAVYGGLVPIYVGSPGTELEFAL